MNIHSNNRSHRQRLRPGEIRLLEKQMRPEIVERCLQFIDVILHQIIYQENIYPSSSHLNLHLFIPQQMYRSVVYQCIDNDISSYITLCVASLRDLVSEQLCDMISVNIIRNFRIPIILRRYLFELRTFHEPCLRVVYDNAKQIIHQLDDVFAQCIHAVTQIKPLNNQNSTKQWTFQFRSSSNRKHSKTINIEEILRQKPIYKEFILTNQQSNLLNGKQSTISSIKSFHTERVQLQFMCENDKYEQEKVQQLDREFSDDTIIDEQDTDTDIDDDQEDIEDIYLSSDSSKKLKESELWPLSSRNDRPDCTLDEQDFISNDIDERSKDMKKRETVKINNIDSDLLIDRYHKTQKIDRETFGSHTYSSDDENQSRSPYSPRPDWEENDNEDDF